MNISLMRRLDFWLGVPLCLLCSIFYAIEKRISGKKKKRSVQKIVFIKLSELGSIILSYPLLRMIKQDYAGCEIFFVTFAKNKEIFNILEEVLPDNNICLVRENNFIAFVLDIIKTIRRLRREKIDLVFDLEFFSRVSAILVYLIRGSKSIGFYRYAFKGFYRGNFLTHRVQYNPRIHISMMFLSLREVSRLEDKYTPEFTYAISGEDIFFPHYSSVPDRSEAMRNTLRNAGLSEKSKIFLINPGEGVLPLREWPLENFIALSRRILEDKDNSVVMVGTEGATKKGEEIVSMLRNPRLRSLVGKTGLQQLMELLNIAEALVTNDCGLGHLAMLSSVNSFILFGPESPQIFSPLGRNAHIIYSKWPCSPCLSILNNRTSFCKDNRCLKSIGVNDVFRLIMESIERKQVAI